MSASYRRCSHVDGWLIRTDGRAGGQHPIRQIVGHRECTVRVRHGGEVADEVVDIAGHQTPRQGLREQFVDGIVRETDGLRFRGHPGQQIFVAVVGVARLLQQRITDLLQPVLDVVLERGDPVTDVLRGGHIPGHIVRQRRRAVQRIGGGEEPSQGVVGECGGEASICCTTGEFTSNFIELRLQR